MQVQKAGNNAAHGELYIVSMGTRECSCKHWQDSGVPCLHATAVVRKFALDRNEDFYTSKYFHETMLMSHRRAMFRECPLIGRLAADSDVAARRANGQYQKLTAVTKPFEGERVTSLRITSTGETSKGRSIKLRDANKRQHQCPHCSKWIMQNPHANASACNKYRDSHKQEVSKLRTELGLPFEDEDVQRTA